MEIENNSRFCSGCGTRVEVEEVLSMREEALQAKKDMMADLEKALPIYQKMASISEKIEKLNNEKNRKLGILTRIIRFYAVAFGGAILGVIAFGIIAEVTGNNTIVAKDGLAIGSSVAVVLKLLLKAKKNRDIDKQLAQYQVELKNYLEQNNCRELYCVPEKYRYYIAVNYIYECLRDGRASDLKEALNMYEEQMHRWKMEGYQQQMLVRSEQQLKVSQAILVSNFFR